MTKKAVLLSRNVFVLFLILLYMQGLAQNKTDISLYQKKDKDNYLTMIESKSGNLFYKLGHHGPAIENQWLAYRLYFNKKAAIDIYSKAKPGLEIRQKKWYPSKKEQLEGWGADYYKVGKTVGLGGIKLWDGSTLHGGDMNLNAMLSPVPVEAKLQSKDYHIWGGSMVSGPNGKYHLFYSRWPKTKGFAAWVTDSEIAHAVSDKPTGPYEHIDVALPGRGAKYWDGLCTHNPTIHRFDGKYYLYYMGNTGDGKNTKGLNWSHRNNQRIGVAVANHPSGPWKRFDQPLIYVSADAQAPDALMVSNPSICRRPDGTYLLVYKCVGKKKRLPFGGPVAHMVATSDSPTGPFKKRSDPVFTSAGDDFPAEDPFIWVQDGKLWAIVKDMRGAFTNKKQSLALFESKDGIKWTLAKHPLVTTPQLNWEKDGIVGLERLERPQLWLNNGVPHILFCAAKDGNQTFNVHIPLKKQE